jgi:AcrR family transcriptional regulator
MSAESRNATAMGRPRDAHADHAILEATLELMAEHGAHALRMDDVAERAGVGKATIYRRYRSKEELVTTAVGELVSEIEVPDSGSSSADLLALMSAAVELYNGSLAAKLMPTLVDEMSRNAELAAVARDRFLSDRRAVLRAVFERGISRRELRADLDIELALDVLAGPLFYRLLITRGPIDDRLAKNTVELIMRGFAPLPAQGATPTKEETSK